MNVIVLISFLLIPLALLGVLVLILLGTFFSASGRNPSGIVSHSARHLAIASLLWNVAMGVVWLISIDWGHWEGIGSLDIVAIPVVVAAIPLLASRSRAFIFATACTALLLCAWSVAGGFSIGFSYTPGPVLMVAAGILAYMREPRAAASMESLA